MQLLRRYFGIRDKDCRGDQGCLAQHIGLCRGPCIDPEGYPERVRTVKRILDGEATELLEELVAKMDACSKNMQFERAGYYRDLIRSIRTTIGQHVVSSKLYRDCDAIGFAEQGDLAALVVLHADEGIVKGQEVWPYVHRGDVGETVSRFISEHYVHRRPPRLLLTPTPLLDGLQQWLDERRGSAVEVRTPMRGDMVLSLIHI